MHMRQIHAPKRQDLFFYMRGTAFRHETSLAFLCMQTGR